MRSSSASAISIASPSDAPPNAAFRTTVPSSSLTSRVAPSCQPPVSERPRESPTISTSIGDEVDRRALPISPTVHSAVFCPRKSATLSISSAGANRLC